MVNSSSPVWLRNASSETFLTATILAISCPGTTKLRLDRAIIATGSQAVDCFAISPSERLYAYAAEGRVIVREHSDGNSVSKHKIEFGELPITICAMAFSRESKRLALGLFIRHGLDLCDLASRRKLLLPREHADKINDLAFAPAGDLLVTASEDGTARMWSVTGGPSLRTIAGHGAS